jgi:predicted HAD superfamily Cof-like phosphohydrolase
MDEKTEHYERVDLFMKYAEQSRPVAPMIPSEDERILRARLILEEAFETVKALGVDLLVDVTGNAWAVADAAVAGRFRYLVNSKANLVEIADGCADLSVVTIGTLIACGIPDRDLLELVDNNNLEKFGPGGYRDEHGKWRKPPTHKPPDIEALLRRLGYREPGT